MPYKTPTQRLRQELEETKAHIQAGHHGIKASYNDRYDQPDDYPEPKRSPATRFLEAGAQLINFTAEDFPREPITMGDPANDAEVVLYGVAMERLLHGVHLTIAPENFIDYMEKNNDNTPTFTDSRQMLVGDVARDLSDEEMGVLCLVLDIVKEQRDNEVHSGYHRRGYSLQMKRLMLEITYFFIQRYADDTIRHPDVDSPLLDHLCEKIVEYKETSNLVDSKDVDVPMIRFDPTDSLP